MEIRKAKIEDAEAIHKLHARAVRDLCPEFYNEVQVNAWLKDRTPGGYYKGIRKGEMYVVLEGDKVIGFGHAIPGEVKAVFVDPSFQGKGIGELLINHGLNIASEGHDKVKVEATLNAAPFYAKYGFVKIKDDIFLKQDQKISIVIMKYTAD